MYRKLLHIIAIGLFWACSSNQPQIYNNFSGNWKCEELGSVSGFKSYVVMIDHNSVKNNQIIIRNFFDTGDNQMIVLTKNDTILSIAEQPTSGHIISNFTGKCSEFNSISYSYTMFDGEKELEFNVVLSRK